MMIQLANILKYGSFKNVHIYNYMLYNNQGEWKTSPCTVYQISPIFKKLIKLNCHKSIVVIEEEC